MMRLLSRARVAVGFLVLAAVLLSVARATGAWGVGWGSAFGKADSRMAAYLAAEPSAMRLHPIDPLTLADVPGGRVLDTSEPSLPGSPYPYESGDGSTLVSVFYEGVDPTAADRDETTVRVLNARTGEERARFNPPVALGGVYLLNADGSRLVSERVDGGEAGPPLGDMEWYVLDTENGRLVRKLRTARPWSGHALHDDDRERLYVVVVPGNDIEAKGPRTPSIVAYDLRSGREAGRVRLDGVLAGSWATERKVRDFPIMAMLEPGLALSPDGRRIAVAHADREAITLIDTERMEIASTRTLTHRRGLLERLGLRPRLASAKALEGVSLRAEFSSDGRRLYVTGQRLAMDASDMVVSTGLGLRSLDVESGEVRAETLDEATLLWVKQSPEGGPVYALKEELGNGSDGSYGTKLLRLDPDTLEVGAERDLTEYRHLLFLRAP